MAELVAEHRDVGGRAGDQSCVPSARSSRPASVGSPATWAAIAARPRARISSGAAPSAGGAGASCGRPPSSETAAASNRARTAARRETRRTSRESLLARGGGQRTLGGERGEQHVGGLRDGLSLVLLPAPREQRSRAPREEQRAPGHHQTVESRFSISSTGSV